MHTRLQLEERVRVARGHREFAYGSVGHHGAELRAGGLHLRSVRLHGDSIGGSANHEVHGNQIDVADGDDDILLHVLLEALGIGTQLVGTDG